MRNKKNRNAHLVCSLTYLSSNGKIVSRVGKYRKISTKILGKKGFGYDPIFIPNKYFITFGQMSKLKN